MKDRDNTDLWTALAIGAVVGIGAALLARSRQDDNDLQHVLKRLKPTRKRAAKLVKNARRSVSRGAHQAGEVGEGVLHASRDMLHDLRENARDIVHTTRRSEERRVGKEG